MSYYAAGGYYEAGGWFKKFFRKVGAALDPTRAGLGRTLLGSVPVIGNTLAGAATAIGETRSLFGGIQGGAVARAAAVAKSQPGTPGAHAAASSGRLRRRRISRRRSGRWGR